MQASVLGHPIFNRKLLARSIILEGRGEGEGRGRRMGGWGPISFNRSVFLFHYIRFIQKPLDIHVVICVYLFRR